MHPSTGSDFKILAGELDAWRLQEVNKIKAAKLDADKERVSHWQANASCLELQRV